MFGNTFTFTDGSDSRTLVKINQDGYASEYLLKSSTFEYRARIRHTRSTPRDSSLPRDRHNVEIVKTVFGATSADPNVVTKVYFVTEQDINDTSTSVAVGLFTWATASSAAALASLTAWES